MFRSSDSLINLKQIEFIDSHKKTYDSVDIGSMKKFNEILNDQNSLDNIKINENNRGAEINNKNLVDLDNFNVPKSDPNDILNKFNILLKTMKKSKSEKQNVLNNKKFIPNNLLLINNKKKNLKNSFSFANKNDNYGLDYNSNDNQMKFENEIINTNSESESDKINDIININEDENLNNKNISENINQDLIKEKISDNLTEKKNLETNYVEIKPKKLELEEKNLNENKNILEDLSVNKLF